MKKTMVKLAGIIALATIIEFAMAACDSPTGGDGGGGTGTTYTLAFHANGATGGNPPASKKAKGGDSVTLPGNTGGMTKEDAVFGGWNTKVDGTGTPYSAGSDFTMPNKDTTLYAEWTAPNTTYTVTFDANGGSGTAPSSITQQTGYSFSLPGQSGLSKTGQVFVGWNTKADGTGTPYSAGAEFTMPNSNIILYAIWNDANITYTVNFDANGGSGSAPAPITDKAGYGFNLPDQFGLSKTGYEFSGWNTQADGTGTNYGVGSIYTIAGDVALYAQWTPLTYTITYLDVGEVTFSGTFQSGYSATHTYGTETVLASPVKKFNIFEGWFINSDGTGTPLTSLSPTGYTANTTLYAKWDVVPLDTVTGLANKLAWLQSYAQSNDDYVLEVNANETIVPQTLSYNDRSNITITLKGTGLTQTISLSSNGSLFSVNSGVTLILDNNIILQGHTNNSTALVVVNNDGTLVMNDGAKISGNTNTGAYSYGGGVYVTGGTFTMNGGEISGNTVAGIAFSYGGGVCVMTGGTFTMNGDATISGNFATTTGGSDTSWSYGGGVYVDNGTFTMNDESKISSNTAIAKMNNFSTTYTNCNSYGGGVSVTSNANFTMNGGEISGNTATSSTSGITDEHTACYSQGGGVYVDPRAGTFTMNGGEISGNIATSTYGFLALWNAGGGVYIGSTFHITDGIIYGSGEAVDIKNTANTGAALSLYSSYPVCEYGNGSTWTALPLPGGTYTDNTIKVVDGVLQ